MSVEQTLAALTEKINARPQGIKGFRAVYRFLLSGEAGGDFQVTFAENRASYQKGVPDEVNCTMVLSDADFIKWVEGRLNPTAALVTGKLKIKGEPLYSIKLQTILNAYQA